MNRTWKEEIVDYLQAAYTNLLTEDSPAAEQPSWITKSMRPHQLTLLEAARQLEKHGEIQERFEDNIPILHCHYGVLADRVGAGKSLVALALAGDSPPSVTSLQTKGNNSANVLSTRRMPAAQEFCNEWENLPSEGLMAAMFPEQRSSKFYLKTALLVVPHTIIAQWESYVKGQTRLNATFIRKTTDCDYERSGFYQRIFQSDLVVVSTSMFRKFTGALSYHGVGFSRYVWSRVFIDEADSINIPSVHLGYINARFMWFITGSWMNMLFESGIHTYHVMALPPDVRTLLGDAEVTGVTSSGSGFIRQTLYGGRDPVFTRLVVRNSDTWIDTSLARPEIITQTIMCETPKNISILRGLISPVAMEALHAGNTAGAISSLGLRTTSQDSLVQRIAEDMRHELEQTNRVLEFKRGMDYSSPSAKGAAIQRVEAKITRIQSQLNTLEERIAESTQESCPICFEPPTCLTLTPCCNKAFCLACICECISKKPVCPMCRGDLREVKSLVVVGSGEMAAAERRLQSKGEALLKLLDEATPDQRFLIFSAHEASFRGLREILGSRGVKCEMLNGSGARIEKLRRQFTEGKVRVLCMNARHVGAGVNLDAATDVILFHRMNTELEKQVIGRAVRFDRNRELRITYLAHESETNADGSQSSEVIVHV